MRIFGRTGDAKKKWRLKAMLVDPHKTRIILELATKHKRPPPWVYRRFVLPQKTGMQPDARD